MRSRSSCSCPCCCCSEGCGCRWPLARQAHVVNGSDTKWIKCGGGGRREGPGKRYYSRRRCHDRWWRRRRGQGRPGALQGLSDQGPARTIDDRVVYPWATSSSSSSTVVVVFVVVKRGNGQWRGVQVVEAAPSPFPSYLLLSPPPSRPSDTQAANKKAAQGKEQPPNASNQGNVQVLARFAFACTLSFSLLVLVLRGKDVRGKCRGTGRGTRGTCRRKSGG